MEVETASPYAAGATICDLHHVVASPTPLHLRRSEFDDGNPNVNVALTMDVQGFWSVMLAAIAAADRVSPMNQILPVKDHEANM